MINFLQRSQLEGIKQWLINVRKALYEVSLEQADLRQHIRNATINIHQEEKVIRP